MTQRHRGRKKKPTKRSPRPQTSNIDIGDAVQKTRKQLFEWSKNVVPPTQSGTPALDDWQKDAHDNLMRGYNVIVDAPTSAGKTRVVESFFDANLEKPNFRAVYTTPVKSLSNDKLREFREIYGDEKVGISTGDIKESSI